jgi:hypothetical protein
MERHLTDAERGILEFMLADEDLCGGDALRAQIPHVRVVDGTPAMPTYLDLAVLPGRATSRLPRWEVCLSM